MKTATTTNQSLRWRRARVLDVGEQKHKDGWLLVADESWSAQLVTRYWGQFKCWFIHRNDVLIAKGATENLDRSKAIAKQALLALSGHTRFDIRRGRWRDAGWGFHLDGPSAFYAQLVTDRHPVQWNVDGGSIGPRSTMIDAEGSGFGNNLNLGKKHARAVLFAIERVVVNETHPREEVT